MQHLLILLTFAILASMTYGFQFRKSSNVCGTSILRQNPFAIKMARAALDESPLELCQENAEMVIAEIKAELGTIFGYDKASRDVGITGSIELVEVDGPNIIVSLHGHFWHATDTVLLRVENFIKTRIPEVIEVTLCEKNSTIQDDNRLNSEGGKKKLY
jgi:hypothetical protein